jgi:hypothetical protein
MNAWTFTVEFDDLETQEARDPELGMVGNDEASQFVQAVANRWSLLPEDLQDKDLIVWDTHKVVLYPDVIDQLSEPFYDLTMLAIPRKVTLER